MHKQKNRYYHGKMLRSEDFICEQDYMLDQMKTRTHDIVGEGILSGLHISKHSDDRLTITAGSAVDAEGNYICLDHDLTLSLEELHGFSNLNADSGWITLHHKEEATDREFCEFPSNGQHEEFGKWQDGYELRIQEHRTLDYLEEQLFRRQILYEDVNHTLYIQLPCLIPETGDIQLTLYMEQKQAGSLSLALSLHSPQYYIQTVEIDRKEEKKLHEQQITLRRNEKVGGHYAVFAIDYLKLDKRVVSPAAASFEIEMTDSIEQAVRSRLGENSLIFQKELTLGMVDFKYEHDRLVIHMVEETGRIECRRPKLDTITEELKQRLHWKQSDGRQQIQERLEIRESCGMLNFQCDQFRPVFHSDEIIHGLGPGEVQIQVALEVQSMQDAAEYQRQLISGDGSLFSKEETVRWAVRSYPWTGSFQAAVAVSESYYEQKLVLHWYARTWDMEHQDNAENRLLRLQPSTITCKPEEVCHFTAVFDREDDSRNVRYSLNDSNGGELNEDGTFIAGHTSGLYQIQAYYRDQQVSAYVKVMEGHE